MYNKNNMLFYKAAIILLFWSVFINFANASDNTEIIGAWSESDASGPFSLVFYSNGYYVHVDEIGIEYGTYNWNSSTGHLVSSVIIDNNGDHGLSSWDPNSPGNSSDNYVFVSGDTLTVIDGDTYLFNRVTHKASASDNTEIIGAWGESDESGPFSLVFYSNGYYVHANKIGIEYGTYNWNSSTGHLITSVIIDNNGSGGLSSWDPNSSGNSSDNYVFVNGDTLTIIDGETFIFSRVNHKISTVITDTDDDGVPDQWDKCQDTPKDMWTDKSGCPLSGFYTIEQMNQAIQKERVKYDPDGDGIVDLKVAIHALQTLSGKINKISDHLHDVSIEKCVDYESSDNTDDNEYEFSIELRTDNSVQYVTVNCPGGKFIEIKDYDDEDTDRFWEYDYEHDKVDDLLQYGDGSYIIELHYSNGYSESTVVNYYDPDQSTPLPLITSIPKFISHDDYELLNPNEPVTFTWDISTIDENAKIVAISCECGDKEYEKMYKVTDNISSQTFNLSNGIWECYFAQASLLEGKNTDNINFELITYSETDYQIIVSESKNIPEATISIDGSNDDWKNIDPILYDPSGDVDLYDGIDITKVYLAKGNNSMFLRLDKAGMSLPTGEYKNNWLYFMPVEKGGKAYAIEIFLFETNVPRIRLFDISVDPYEYDQYIQLLEVLDFSVNMQAIELSWPISYFSESSSYSLKFLTHYTVNKEWKDNGDINDNTIVIKP